MRPNWGRCLEWGKADRCEPKIPLFSNLQQWRDKQRQRRPLSLDVTELGGNPKPSWAVFVNGFPLAADYMQSFYEQRGISAHRTSSSISLFGAQYLRDKRRFFWVCLLEHSPRLNRGPSACDLSCSAFHRCPFLLTGDALEWSHGAK
jgi:hypothetical protein